MILIADDHRMIREGLFAMLPKSTATIHYVIDVAETTEEAIERSRERNYDIILMDFHLPGIGGPKATEIILRRNPHTRVLTLSSYDERAYVDKMLQAGARGYILKNVEPDTLVIAIKTVLAGKLFFSNEIALKLMQPPMVLGNDEPPRLSPREQEVLMLIRAGLKGRQIAIKMGISPRTVFKHRLSLMTKLGAHNAVELAQAALQLDLH
ncbi:response regulator [Dinghuibacter silviterrae]|uniref:LuxR family two component transcriptional regulator n=1 Tax=Dinghuibacter silviterrae TaxID=1539049 RepID=A0A4R8DIS2_9BACT|nr:response regulator transcription factor [Dinghuibacter silviterrae]TDW97076.1 LuxR family two component transcriptional regulator [Dinghuibacter silviterrae]